MANAELKLEYWPIDRLVDYARNPRKNDQVVPKMVASIKEFGFKIPVLARSDGTVIDGHLRLKAARKLGMETVPVTLADDLTETQVKAFRILANQSANWAEWDNDLLKLELDDLKLDGFDLDLTGFDEAELKSITGGDEETSPAADEFYTSKMSAPQYEPTGRDVSLADCVDTAKRDELISEIDASALPEDEKRFLRFAADRFLKFSYSNVAEYYANASPEMQSIMEDLALVIIDYDDALRKGFVHLTKTIEEIRNRDQPS